MGKLWEKNYSLDQTIEQFETGDDLVLDNQLVEPDVYSSLAHAKMIYKIGVLNQEELTKLTQALKEILQLFEKGEFKLEFGDEDIHTKIENFLINRCGPAGQKIHTARSRNDQILTDLRLYAKEQLLNSQQAVLLLAQTLLTFAKKYTDVPMPGYTHMQKAMPSSVGTWVMAYAESLLDDLELLKDVYRLNNQSPLGSAAGYGVPLPIDREMTAKLLGFDKVQNNVLYCQNSRGKIESITLSALTQVSLDISKLATDVLLFTTAEFGYFQVQQELTTGSSIMPQKFNLDLCELLRSKHHLMVGYWIQIMGIISNIPSGYNRDLQDTKKPLMEALNLTQALLKVSQLLIQGLTPNQNRLRKSMTKELYATHHAYRMVTQGVPFRTAYKQTAEMLDKIEVPDLDNALKSVKHTGGSGNLNLDKFEQKASSELKRCEEEINSYHKLLSDLTI